MLGEIGCECHIACMTQPIKTPPGTRARRGQLMVSFVQSELRAFLRPWWHRFINAVAPSGYQDRSGFHLNRPRQLEN